ncbi:MAG: DUF3667 domain-containing protein [Pseudomonadota bacterium]
MVIGLVQDVIVDTISVDSKLARTLGMLLWRPGRLARNYLDGKRVRYTAPFRLFLFSSLLFFLLAWSSVPFEALEPSLNNEAGEEGQSVAGRDASNEGLTPIPIPDGPTQTGDGQESEREPTVEAEASATCEDSLTDRSPSIEVWMCEHIVPAFERIELAGERAQDDPRLFFAQLRDNIPRVMLLAPILYAVTLAVLYIYRRRYLVYDHLIVSLYMHAALYVYLSAAMVAFWLPLIGGLLAGLLLLYAAFQPLLVYRQAYGSNWLSAILKYLVSNAVYFSMVSVLLVLGVGYALYQS